jgi:small GTP-binding protein
VAEKHKICMLGASGVGKTSLVIRFVHRIFSDAYVTTIGVRIDKARVSCGREMDLVIWDLSGEDEFQSVNLAYLRGASGLLVVVDGTRRATLDVALRLLEAARAREPAAACVFVLNKSDLSADWDIDDAAETSLRRVCSAVIETSAKTGAGVEGAFCALASAMFHDASPLVRGAG